MTIKINVAGTTFRYLGPLCSPKHSDQEVLKQLKKTYKTKQTLPYILVSCSVTASGGLHKHAV